jgi:hypothetical protein
VETLEVFKLKLSVLGFISVTGARLDFFLILFVFLAAASWSFFLSLPFLLKQRWKTLTFGATSEETSHKERKMPQRLAVTDLTFVPSGLLDIDRRRL